MGRAILLPIKRRYYPNTQRNTVSEIRCFSWTTDFQEQVFKDLGLEMMKYVEDYSVSTLIVKDLSRLGREYSYMGRLQDFIFPAYDVRFIAINDDVDSAKGDNDFAVFKNVFNDYYAKDTSKKIRAVVKMRGESGEHIASNPPYGYIKDRRIKRNG